MKNDPSRAESTFQQCSCRPIQILQTAEHLAMDRVPQVPLTRALHHQGSTYAGYVQRDIREGVDEDHISNCGAHLANPPQHRLEQPMLQRDPNGMGRKKPLTCPGCTHILAADPDLWSTAGRHCALVINEKRPGILCDSGSFLAEDGGFEPPRALTQHAFQACAIGR